MKIGKSRYGGGRQTFKIKDGDNVYRILPPLGNLADLGQWRKFYSIQWGFKGSDGKMKPFQDCRVINYSTKMVEVESAAFLLREKLKENKELALKNFRANPESPSHKAEYDKANDLVLRFNLENRHYLNAVNLNGEIGLLKINTKFKNALESQIDELRKRGVDPLSSETGVFFNFYRSNPTGKISDWNFQVTPYQETVKATVNGQEMMVKQEKVHNMHTDPGFTDRLDNEAYDLSDMYPAPSPEEVKELVAALNTAEEAAVVDRILGKVADMPAAATDTPLSAGGDTLTATASPSGPTTATSASVPSTHTAEAPSAIAEPVVSTPTPSMDTAPATTKEAELSDEEWLAKVRTL